MVQQVRTVRFGLHSVEGNAKLHERSSLHSKSGEWLLSYADPAAWFNLRAVIPIKSDLSRFKSRLKIHLFILAFNLLNYLFLYFIVMRLRILKQVQ
jgi:hypothetical protein